MSSSPGRDPLKPFGQEPPPSVSINSFATPPPGNGKWVWLIAGAIVVLVGILVIPMLLPSDPDPLPSVTASSTASPSASSTTRLGDEDSIPFETVSASGFWEITSSQWINGELVVNMKITLDSGSLDFEFFAFEHEGAVVQPTYGIWDDELRPGYLAEGESVQGKVTFPVSEGSTTVVLSDSTRTNGQITALMVEP